MSKTDLLDSLGTLAKSGAEDFRRTAGVEAAKDIIGQVRRDSEATGSNAFSRSEGARRSPEGSVLRSLE